MSQTQSMNSRCFTCTLLAEDPEIGEPLIVLTLRQVKFAHTPVILTASETRELYHLLAKWHQKTGGPGKTSRKRKMEADEWDL